jgi:nucleoside-diphosphate-sugar epimerase
LSSPPQKILLTGASGFLGKTFNELYQDQFQVEKLNLRNGIIETDYSSYECLIHCAAMVHKINGAPEKEYFAINAELTKKLAIIAKKNGLRHFIFISTVHVYGDSGSVSNHEQSYSENSQCHPKDAYGRSKLLAEKYLQELADANFTVSIVRSPLVYGKGSKGNIVSLIKLIQKCPILPLAYKQNHRSIIYVENLCYFIQLLVQQKVGGIFLPQDEHPVSTAELVRLISKALNKKILLLSMPCFLMRFIFFVFPKQSSRLFGTLQIDSRISNQLINYKPPYSTLDGLKKTLG